MQDFLLGFANIISLVLTPMNIVTQMRKLSLSKLHNMVKSMHPGSERARIRTIIGD